ncbi:MAG: hypothetical protein WCI51_19665 [Lentisphaerota bacterium]
MLEIKLMAYHPLGESKINRLGRPSIIDGQSFADEKVVARWVKNVKAGTTVTVKKR